MRAVCAARDGYRNSGRAQPRASRAMLDPTSHIRSRRRALATKDPQEPFTRISVSEAKEKLDQGEAVMVDVRDPHEYVEVHATGVRLIPVNTVLNEIQQIRDLAGDK